jgi:hypothetical protein
MATRPPRRPRNGHTADCPYQHRTARGCAVCAGERLAPDPDDDQASPVARAFGHASQPGPALVACLDCFAPIEPGAAHRCLTPGGPE